MSNAEVICERAEVLGESPDHRARYDFALARAVGNVGLTAELCLPFVRVGGIAATTRRVDQWAEVEASRDLIELLGGQLKEPVEREVPGFAGPRRYLLIEKVRPTPDGFPRRAARLGERVR